MGLTLYYHKYYKYRILWAPSSHFTLEYAGPAAPCSWAKNADGWGLVHNPALNGKPNSCIDTGPWASVPFQNLIHFPRSAFLQQVHVSHPRGELIQSHLVNTASLAVSLYSLLSLRLSLLHSNYSLDAVRDILLRQACFRTGAISSCKHMFVLFKWNWTVSLHRKHSARVVICKLWKTAHQVRMSLTWVFALWWRRPRLSSPEMSKEWCIIKMEDREGRWKVSVAESCSVSALLSLRSHCSSETGVSTWLTQEPISLIGLNILRGGGRLSVS